MTIMIKLIKQVNVLCVLSRYINNKPTVRWNDSWHSDMCVIWCILMDSNTYEAPYIYLYILMVNGRNLYASDKCHIGNTFNPHLLQASASRYHYILHNTIKPSHVQYNSFLTTIHNITTYYVRCRELRVQLTT